MSYRDGLNYLSSKTRIFELCNQMGGRLIVCPDWGGRVMTSTCDGIDGHSFGLINVREIDAGQEESKLGNKKSYRNFGGEDFMVLPIEGEFVVDSIPQDPMIRMRYVLRLPAELDIVRIVSLLNRNEIQHAFGNDVAISLEQTEISYVGFATTNTLVYPEKSHSIPANTDVAVHLAGMFNSGQNSVAIIPFRTENRDRQDDGEMLEDHIVTSPVETFFFDSSPHGRLRMLPHAALLRTDGRCRCQVVVPRKQALPILGDLDFRSGCLTLTTFDLEQFDSDEEMSDDNDIAVQAYNHGISAEETSVVPYFRFDFFSPVHQLAKGESLTQHRYTLHINADNQTLEYIIAKTLGVEYKTVYDKMIR